VKAVLERILHVLLEVQPTSHRNEASLTRDMTVWNQGNEIIRALANGPPFYCTLKRRSLCRGERRLDPQRCDSTREWISLHGKYMQAKI
jgi:hypothetical protein